MQEERWEKIKKAKYNRWYGWINGEGIPIYLRKSWGERRYRRIARFRLGNEMKKERYWKGEEERKCRFCESGVKSWRLV